MSKETYELQKTHKRDLQKRPADHKQFSQICFFEYCLNCRKMSKKKYDL